LFSKEALLFFPKLVFAYSYVRFPFVLPRAWVTVAEVFSGLMRSVWSTEQFWGNFNTITLTLYPQFTAVGRRTVNCILQGRLLLDPSTSCKFEEEAGSRVGSMYVTYLLPSTKPL